MSTSSRPFEAPDLIEVMDTAVRYNQFLVDALLAWGRGAGRLLDYGAGNGRFCGALAEQGFDLVAVEPDASLRDQIRARGVPVSRDLETLGDERFGGAYSINVLEHVEDDVGLLASLHERLVARGRLFLYVPAFPVLFSANDTRVGHLRRYRRKGLLAAVEAAGFRVTRAVHVDSLGFAAGLWYRHFGDPQGGLDPAAVRLYDRAVFPLSRALDALTRGALGKNLLCEAVRA
ncbi:MAG TPA: class I SAM-dependent methyltransferase [Myxococcota bacterium]|nr:class I SAM-dependent methyltransferase [Myxococcota bacterium]